MAKPFRSKFQLHEPLIDTLREDRFHIGVAQGPPERRRGNHIGVVHDALLTWAATAKGDAIAKAVAAMKASDVPSQNFGDKTAAVVVHFKTDRKLFNSSRKIDAVIGKQTIDKLDDVLPRYDASDELRKKQARDSRAKQENTIDFVIVYDGADHFSEKMNNDESIFPITSADPYSRTGRKLFRISADTKTIGVASMQFLTRHADLIQKKLDGREVGKICICGSSSGGRNAIDLATRLHFGGLPVAYLASADAAFFPIEARNSPQVVDGVLNTPTFGPFVLSAGSRQNFYQTLGNRTETAFLAMKTIFSSKMANKEVHGTISGFRDRNLTEQIRSQRPKDDNDAHSRCVGDGMDRALLEVRQLLNGLAD